MAEGVMMPEPWDEVGERLLLGESVVVDGGAGSGKTYALVKTIARLHEMRPELPIACITYTNAAAGEVMSRLDSKNLRVSTIHDFLWDCIGRFQRELVEMLKEAVKNEEAKAFKAPVDELGDEVPLDFNSVSYRDYVRLAEGVVSHNQVLVLARMMFERHGKLRRLTADRFPCVLVDEYQDTSQDAIDVLVSLVEGKTCHRCSVAFFGDPMQSIYDGSVGDLNELIERKLVVRVQIDQNRRNPASVIELANKLRVDGLRQTASNDEDAPNMCEGKLLQGKVLLVEGDDPHGESGIIRSGLLGNRADDEVKILRLTHKLIAEDGGFPTIQSVYNGSDPILAFANRVRERAEKDGRQDLGTVTLGELAGEYPCKQRGGKATRLEEITNDSALKAEFDKAANSTFEQLRCHHFKSENLYAVADARGFASDWCPVMIAARKLNIITHLYEEGNYSALFDNSGRVLVSRIADKEIIARNLQVLVEMKEQPVEEMIDYALSVGLIELDDAYSKFRADHAYLFGRMRGICFGEFEAFFRYYNDYSPYMTQHKAKGLEYDYVIVTLDNGGWNHYNFSRSLIPPADGSEEDSVTKRTRKLLYVACTRAKKGLALYNYGACLDMETVNCLFEPDQVVALEDLVS